MVLDRLKQMASQITGQVAPPYPLDPLSEVEIEKAVGIIRKEHADLHYNAVTLWEPRKVEMQAWLANPQVNPKPKRKADVVCIGPGSKVYDGIVDLEDERIISFAMTEGAQPLVSTHSFCEDCVIRANIL